jgi:hypothetical protein
MISTQVYRDLTGKVVGIEVGGTLTTLTKELMSCAKKPLDSCPSYHPAMEVVFKDGKFIGPYKLHDFGFRGIHTLGEK